MSSVASHALEPQIPPPNASDIAETPLPVHAIIRSIQCARCSRPLRTPLRLPCGNSICRSCLPPIHQRTGITYPANEERKQGFLCYWGKEDKCTGEHCLGDCGADVLLNRLVDVFEETLADRGASSETESGQQAGAPTMLWKTSRDALHGATTKCEIIGFDLLKGVYGLVQEGRFDYDASNVHYSVGNRAETATQRSFMKLKDAIRSELDCQVCYSLILDPLTTPCGHTFCRDCVTMVMDHSDLCPVCRRKLNMSATPRREPSNLRISSILKTFFPEQLAMRKEGTNDDAAAADDEQTLPLFVNSLSFPTMPTFLHVFEPRYRIMMRRVMQTRGKKFGMVMYNRGNRAQPGLGRSEFMQYGTVLMVDRYELLPDGRSLIIATGVSRFKVISAELVDGYHVGRVQRVEDVPVTEEERLESLATSATLELPSTPGESPAERPLETMPTQQLFELVLDFIAEQRQKGVAWLHPRVLLAYGDAPTDPAVFPWWLASVYPLWEDEKYSLLSTTSVRARLEIVARWVKKAGSREWLARSRPSFSSAL
ncbi:putative ATP-dependent protease (CrgA) [Aspergillus homomorphus CBS 101889]|uniref:Putative ATP-dependent protease n=1 Tax=Aspergillus homomorphus (strain CBS 101889) TaxID=1450537 RepID=A0A395HXN7_ASPHC|nr:putative ATP-dependent protease [Aspergillus homomorphus CBS 101889]RAL11628.1 putative ATP-dependent protease [Aspergillus homomorphus CBS 101889]